MGCSVPQDRRLLWPYPSFCTPPGGLMIMSAWSCACAPAAVDASVISRKTADLKFWSDFGAK
jgi:hypothetical protein